MRNKQYTSVEGEDHTIIAAAILYKNRIWSGTNHGDLIRQVICDTASDDDDSQYTEGFLTDISRFVDRETAKQIAIQSGQIKSDYPYGLTSQLLW